MTEQPENEAQEVDEPTEAAEPGQRDADADEAAHADDVDLTPYAE